MDIQEIRNKYKDCPRGICTIDRASLYSIWSDWHRFIYDDHFFAAAGISIFLIIAALATAIIVTQSALLLTFVLYALGAYYTAALLICFYFGSSISAEAGTHIFSLASVAMQIASVLCLALGYGDTTCMWIGGVLSAISVLIMTALVLYNSRRSYVDAGELFAWLLLGGFIPPLFVVYVIPTVAYPFYWGFLAIKEALINSKSESEEEGMLAAAQMIADALAESAVVGELAEYFTPICLEKLWLMKPPRPKQKPRTTELLIRVKYDSVLLEGAHFVFENAKVEKIESYVELYGLALALSRRLERELAESAATIAKGHDYTLTASVSPREMKSIFIPLSLTLMPTEASKRRIYDAAGEHSEKS